MSKVKKAVAMRSMKVELATEMKGFGLSPHELMIGRLSGFSMMSFEQILFIGKGNLTYLRDCWQQVLAEAEPSREQLRKRYELIEGKTVADLRKMAEQYDCPEYATVKNFYLSCGDQRLLDPEDPESFKREAGSTTLNICGWCEHALGETFPYRDMRVGGERVFRPSCGFLDMEWMSCYERDFNFPCMLTHGDETKLERIREKLRKKYRVYEECYEGVRRRIECLESLIERAEVKPVFRKCRRAKDFALGARVYFLRAKSDNEFCQNLRYPFKGYGLEPWTLSARMGTVIGYGEDDKHILVRYDGPDGVYENAAVTDFSCMMMAGDLEYFAQHRDYAQIWDMMGDGVSGLVWVLEYYDRHGQLPER